MPNVWNYSGDVGLRHGGLYWREDDAESAFAVGVIPCSDAGGPDNLFRIVDGSVHMPAAEIANALKIIGGDPETATREDLVRAFVAYHGIEADAEYVVRIGSVDPFWSGRGDNPTPEMILPANVKLRNFVRREHLASA